MWTITSDGSLRNGGVEFITTGGKGGEVLHSAFERIVSLLERVNYDASWRCSTHMHLNMLDFTCNQVARYMLVYAACEPVLFALAGNQRRSSNFCTPLGDSLVFHKKLIARLYDDTVANRLASAQTSKYTALNFQPLFGNQNVRPLGTIEFRGGRPMTTMNELLLQANILLSIKDFVRTFVGTEDEMLVRLGDGVFNTVFANGCAASLQEVKSDELEFALIQAWMLLKAYQQGMTERTAPPERGHSFFNPGNPFAQIPDLPVDWNQALPTRNSRARPARAPVVEDPDNLPYWSATRPVVGSLYTNTYPREVFTSEYSQARWPMLHQWLDVLQDPEQSVSNKARRMLEVLRDPAFLGRLPTIAATKTVVNWVLDQRVDTAERTPIGTIIRAVENQARPMSRRRNECVDTSVRANEQPRCVQIRTNVDYMNLLPLPQRQRIASYMQYPHDLINNRFIWQWLMTSTVVLENMDTLRRAFTERTNGNSTHSIPSTMTAVQAFTLFRICDVRSEDHLSGGNLSLYDRVTAVAQLLRVNSLDYPALCTAIEPDGSLQRNLLVVHTVRTPLYFRASVATTETHQTHEPRVSAVTGQRIY